MLLFEGWSTFSSRRRVTDARHIPSNLKQVAETCNPDDIIIVTSSLTKDMNSSEDLFRANSIRVLAKM